MDRFNDSLFGINYDTGNSASLGYDCSEEIRFYGKQILNVHIKDRKLYGSTVPLGYGNTNFNKIFQELNKISYRGNFILQTARAIDGDHQSVLLKYYNKTEEWINKYKI